MATIYAILVAAVGETLAGVLYLLRGQGYQASILCGFGLWLLGLYLLLTLGALAEIESGLGLADLSEVSARLKQLRAADLAIVAAALLRGGGHEMTPAEVLRLPCDLGALVGAVADAFDAAGLAGAAEGAAGEDERLVDDEEVDDVAGPAGVVRQAQLQQAELAGLLVQPARKLAGLHPGRQARPEVVRCKRGPTMS